MRWRTACARRREIFVSPTPPIDPAITVKSYAATATGRPSISPIPVIAPHKPEVEVPVPVKGQDKPGAEQLALLR